MNESISSLALSAKIKFLEVFEIVKRGKKNRELVEKNSYPLSCPFMRSGKSPLKYSIFIDEWFAFSHSVPCHGNGFSSDMIL